MAATKLLTVTCLLLAVIACPDGGSFALEIVRYQFPSSAPSESPDYDANWLSIRIDVATHDGRWTAVDPCLLTWEVFDLAKWLRSVAAGDPGNRRIEFVEPSLAFELVEDSGDGRRLRVCFELECRPPWASADFVGAEPCYVDFPLEHLNLREAARALLAQLRRYPVREP